MDRLSSFWRILTSDRNRLLYTCLILMNHFAIGISINILSAVLVDLSYIYDVSIDKITFLNTSLGVGYIVGALAGFTYRFFNRQLLLGVAVSMLAITTALIPRYGSFAGAVTAMLFSGLGFGAWNGSQTSWVVELWPQYPTVALQSTELLFGLGGIVGPLLASPFVYGENNNIPVEKRISSLTVPFLINGILQFIVPILLLSLYFLYPYRKQSESLSSSESMSTPEGTIVENIVPHRLSKLALGALCLGTYVASESSYVGFSPTMFQKIGVQFPANEAAIVASMLLTTFTLGRFVTAMIGNLVTPDSILCVHFGVIFTSLIGLYLGRYSRPMVYIGSILLGYGFSAMTATIMSFSQRHLKLTDKVCSIYAFTAGIFVVMVPLILAQTFKTFPEVLFLIQACFLSACVLLFATAKVWIWYDSHSSKY